VIEVQVRVDDEADWLVGNHLLHFRDDHLRSRLVLRRLDDDDVVAHVRREAVM